jgi:hypothetical protein
MIDRPQSLLYNYAWFFNYRSKFGYDVAVTAPLTINDGQSKATKVRI